MKRAQGVICMMLLTLYLTQAGLGQPEIANVFPDFPNCDNTPKIITGEGFDPASTRIWTWSPKSDKATVKKALSLVKDGQEPLPTKPPEDAQSQVPIDVESQVTVAQLSGSVMWVETPSGISKPLLFDIAKPCWLSESQAIPGAMVYAF